jgi:hypothetical protein
LRFTTNKVRHVFDEWIEYALGAQRAGEFGPVRMGLNR